MPLIRKNLVKLTLSPQNPLRPVPQCHQDRGRFKYGILCVERHSAIYVPPYDRFAQSIIDVADLYTGIFAHGRSPENSCGNGGCDCADTQRLDEGSLQIVRAFANSSSAANGEYDVGEIPQGFQLSASFVHQSGF